LVRLSVAPILAAGVVSGALVVLENLYVASKAEFSWVAIPFAVSESAYTQLMSIVAQIAAAILALFFAAISVVTSTSYAKVTSEIRAVVAHDDLNRRYLRLLAHLAAVGASMVRTVVPAACKYRRGESTSAAFGSHRV
jgi:hypothetical protein